MGTYKLEHFSGGTWQVEAPNAEGFVLTVGKDKPFLLGQTKPALLRYRRVTAPVYTVPSPTVVGTSVRLDFNTAPLFRGVVEAVDAALDLRGTTDYTAADIINRLRIRPIWTNIYENIRTDTALTLILNAVGLGSSPRQFDTGLTTLRYWYVSGDDAWAAIQKVVLHEGGVFYIATDGTFVFRNRHSQQFETPVQLNDTQIHNAVYRLVFDTIINDVSVSVTDVAWGGTETVFSLDRPVTIPPNGTLTLEGTSTKLFRNLTFTSAGDVTVQALATSGERAGFAVTAGASGGTLTALTATAQVGTKQETIVRFRDQTSIDAYGAKPVQVKLDYSNDMNFARDFGQYLISRYAQPQAVMDITRVAGDDSVIASLCQTRMNSRFVISIPRYNLTFDGFTSAIRHKGSPTMHETTITLENAAGIAYWVLDNPTYSKLDQTTRLGW